MIVHNPTPDYNPNVLETKPFLHLQGFFYRKSECIITKNNIINVQQTYDLLDFLDNYEIYKRKVRFWHATLKGFTLKLFVLDIKTGELLHRSHRMNTDYEICDWVIMDTDVLGDSNDEDVIRDYCGNK